MLCPLFLFNDFIIHKKNISDECNCNNFCPSDP